MIGALWRTFFHLQVTYIQQAGAFLLKLGANSANSLAL
jgi:hypothetical protein